MEYYPLLKNTHIFIALVSGIGFALRGYIRVILNHPLPHPVIRIGPHIVDTLLLISGVTMWVMVGWPFFSWLGLKIALIVLYILLAMGSFRSGHSPRGVILYLVSLITFVIIAIIAVHKPI